MTEQVTTDTNLLAFVVGALFGMLCMAVVAWRDAVLSDDELAREKHAYREALASFLGAIERLEAADKLCAREPKCSVQGVRSKQPGLGAQD